MAISYDIYTIPDPQDADKQLSHVRMVSNGFTEAKDLEKLICKRCTVTSTDIVAVLDALSHAMQDEFLQGRRVHLQGIGYFQPIIQAMPETDKEEMQKVRAPQLKVKSIAFRPEKEWMESINKEASFRPPKHADHSKVQTEISITELLTNYFADHDELDRNKFQELCNQTRSTAMRWIRKLIADGKLENIGNRHAPRDRAVPGNFGVSKDKV